MPSPVVSSSKVTEQAPPKAGALEDVAIGPPVSATVLQQLRRERAKKLFVRVLAFVVTPTLVSWIYFWQFASNEYESTSIVVVERREPLVFGNGRLNEGSRPEPFAQPTVAADSKGKKNGNVAGIRDDALLVKEFILSHDMWSKLDEGLRLRAHFGSTNVDWLSRLAVGSSRESAFAYYLKHVTVNHDAGSATLTLKTRAFDRALTAQMNDLILRESELRLNSLSRRAQEDKLQLAELELTRATKSASTATEAPHAELAQQRLDNVQALVDSLRDDLAHPDRYIVRVAGPSLPDEASYPRRGRAVMTTLLACIIGMGIGSLLFSAIREHSNL